MCGVRRLRRSWRQCSQFVVLAMTAQGFGDQVAIQPIREQFGKLEDEIAEVGTPLERDPRNVGSEDVAHRLDHQVGVGVVAHGHLGHDADAQAEPHIGLDDVGVDRLERDARRQLLLREGMVDARAAGERRVVGDDRLGGQVFERHALLAGQRVILGQHQHVLPFVAGQGDQLGVGIERFGGDTDLGDLVDDHPGDLLGRALMQADVDLGIGLAQPDHRHRQHVARLGVRGGDRQRAAVLGTELFADALEVADLPHDEPDAGQHVLAGFGDTLQALAVPREDLDPEFFLEFDDGLGDPRLRGVERLGRLGQVEVAANRFLDKLELVQIHNRFRLNSEFIMPARVYRRAGDGLVAKGEAGQQIDHFGCFADGLAQDEANAGMLGAKRVDERRQVFTQVLSDAEEERDDADFLGAGRHQFGSRAGQGRLDEFEVRRPHPGARLQGSDARCHGFDRCAPTLVARTVREQEEAEAIVRHACLWSMADVASAEAPAN
ncbi:conserved hypothetical protein [Burkholderiales bacterium 8X]|nr:conserved hypothetical protein [Burkholderiales bacterium 8X]